MYRDNKIIALIVAAGRGLRFNNAGTPKQYSMLAGKTVLRHTLEKFIYNKNISQVQVVIHPDDISLYNDAIHGLEILPPVFGGGSRAQSVYNGLIAIKELNPKHVLVSDAMRPFVSAKIIDCIISNLNCYECVVPVIPIVDTVKTIEGDYITSTYDRDKLRLAQTPQGCDYNTILNLLEKNQNYTDEASCFEHANKKVKYIDGDINNFKITFPQDINRAETLLNMQYETRVGIGFDVHKFKKEEGDNFIVLGGVKIPHQFMIEAHSDGDVLIHALVDAILGAIGHGDIGIHFPPSDMQWKNVSSTIFLEKAKELLEQENGRIVNIDITIICEAPKIFSYKNKIEKSLAVILNINEKRINLKATTTENLGSLGRKEGIAVQALANILIP
jgi:2-C-methyl-D-erythritol 4-phosphate cytidylyltransferase / 2-C-methyl-D-erythritol 2,4-cyclodiphosphate synthase